MLSAGTYTTTGARSGALAQSFFIHGHGASVTGGSSDFATLETNVPTTIKDLSLRNSDTQGLALGALATSTLVRAKLAGYTGLGTSAPTTANDLEIEIEASNIGITCTGASSSIADGFTEE